MEELEKPEGLSWLRMDKEGRLLVEEKTSTRVLRSRGELPCNLIAIFGAARQGKSFLMNLLSGYEDLFRISNEKEPCTQGVDMCSRLSSLDRFSAIDATISNVKGDLDVGEMDMAVGFVDAEGQGDRDVTYDARLICPVLLASKCIIFNWKDSLQKDRILNLLGVMTTAAEGVDISARAEGYAHSHIDSDGDGKGKPFAHLHIVFR